MSTGFTREREQRLDAVNIPSRLKATAHPACVGYKSSSEDLRQVELGCFFSCLPAMTRKLSASLLFCLSIFASTVVNPRSRAAPITLPSSLSGITLNTKTDAAPVNVIAFSGAPPLYPFISGLWPRGAGTSLTRALP
ncbi:hypothetical protein PsYK624_118950 [Phanerochaete sordida]|uniref:Uncharacterized protein n=1 Tax=Phanerochaete sordida TaxID=48140 RepID=A0A9P3LII6_9APHY|nr:hypothetical protein PsYK624_118950 [Phanerochaete sordida]